MSLTARKPFAYPIAITITVTNCTKIEDEDENWTFDMQFTSNVTTWEISHTLSEFHQFDFQVTIYVVYIHIINQHYNINIVYIVKTIQRTELNQITTIN